MRQEAERRGVAERLAPIAFVAGVLMLGLSLLAISFAATAPAHGPVEHFDVKEVNGSAILSYPVPASPYVPARLEVSFRFPEHGGAAMALSCRDHARVMAGGEPLAPQVRTEGVSGAFSTTLAPADGCPFVYAVFRWPLQGGALEDNRPDVDIVTGPLILPGLLRSIVAIAALAGAALATWGGVAWGRRLGRERDALPAGDEESTTETLLHAIARTGAWLERTRRYLVLAGVLGVFLWYPVVLPWAWTTAVEGTHERWWPWLLAGGALAMLLALTAVWAREYLRLDRELVAWRKRVDRLHAREAALLSELDSPR